MFVLTYAAVKIDVRAASTKLYCPRRVKLVVTDKINTILIWDDAV
jgi:hypothetical protein